MDGRTALILTMMEDDHLGIRFLLERGANPHIPDYKDCDACDYAKGTDLAQMFPEFKFCPRVRKPKLTPSRLSEMEQSTPKKVT
jgi:hypothetical protein